MPIPAVLWRWALYALLAAAVVAGATWCVHTYNDSLRQEGRDEILAEWNGATLIAQQTENTNADERRKKEKEATDETAAALSYLAANAAGAHAASDRLQRRVDELVAAARRAAGTGGAPVGPAPGQQGQDPAGMLADMQGRIDAAAGRIGNYADFLRIAGQGCERRFDAVAPIESHPLSAGSASPDAP